MSTPQLYTEKSLYKLLLTPLIINELGTKLHKIQYIIRKINSSFELYHKHSEFR
jgi:hypothetical protein